MKISKPGVYSISMQDYHSQLCAGPSISSSRLRTIFTQSPAHYWCRSELNPERIDEDETEKAHFVLGRAAHHLLLGEDAFSTLFICRPEQWDSWRTKDARQWRESQEADGRTVLIPSQLDAIRGMAKSLAKHPLVTAGILNGQIEQSLIWRDRETGVWLKCRPDAIPNESGDFADLKTSSNFGEDLDRDVFRHRYDIQAALTKWAAKEVLKLEMESFSFVFVGVKPPYCVDVLTLDKEDIQHAEKDLRQAVRTFAWCLEHDNWFQPAGTQSDARYVHIPDWAKERAQFRREFLEREITRAEEATARYGAAELMGAG